ncbi:MAG: M2 family metallopeptidase [Sphingomonadaceae bacterium]
MRYLLAALAAATCLATAVPATAQSRAPAAPPAAATRPPTAAEAEAFVRRAEAAIRDFSTFAAQVNWINATYITDDTDAVASKVNADFTELGVGLATEAARYRTAPGLSPETARKLDLLRQSLTLPAPTTPGSAQELSTIATRLQSTYGRGRGTLRGQTLPGVELEALMGTERDPRALQEMWTSWHAIARPMRADYVRLVEIGNAGARELGYRDLGAMWRSGYDMPPEEFARLTDRLWTQVKPLYDQLHCYTRAKLSERHGPAVQRPTGPIRADLLGNMWAQEWGNIYDVVAPPGTGDIGFDLTDLLVKAGYDPVRMVKAGEAFYTSLGLAPLPETFWTRSQITRPEGREVICHASAWNIDNQDDIRIKMCTKVNADDFVTIHHELGHNYYQRAYKNQSPLYWNGANDGFHEAIGDFIALSVTPEYLVQIGLLKPEQVPSADKDIGLLLRQAMDKVAFLPFGLLVDKWRWGVFSGQIRPADYTAAWNALRLQYQGITPPVERSDPTDFDPGAKYHIPGNTPYMRYFLARILQFQFYKAACDMAGWTGPLHRCSFYGNKEVGARLSALLEMGASRPWPDALEAFTGSREMDGSAMIAYFAPLQAWLEEQNRGRQCGW